MTAGSTVQVPAPDLSAIPQVWVRYTDIHVDRGEGSWLIASDGTRYLDYSSGIGVTNTGHAHPRVVAAIREQAGKLLHGQQNIVYHEPGVILHNRLRQLLPNGPWQAFLSNSGAEAVEAAVKLSRAATRRPAIVTFRYGFHGRTGQTMAMSTSRVTIRGDFEPLPGSVYQADYPYCYRAPVQPHSPDACICEWETRLDLLFNQVVDPRQVAAIFVEPVLGEGGYVVPPDSFLPKLREIASRYGILLALDEVQSGYGRTGNFFAHTYAAVEPDIVVVAKGIASGLPLSGIIARADLMEAWNPGAHGGTYGGNVVSCAAAIATLDVIEDEGLVENARLRGEQLLAGLRKFKETYKTVGDARGRGLMAAIELVKPNEGDGRLPATELTQRVQQEALRRRLVVLTAGSYGNVLRFVPPLVTTEDEVAFALDAISGSLAAAGAGDAQ